jgi:rifamycin polyketide synthase module 1/2/3
MLRVELICPIPELLAERAERLGDKTAFQDDRRSISYTELDRRTGRLAGHLADLGISPGDRVLIYMDDCVETAESYLAMPRCGAVGVCVNPNGAPREIGFMLRDCEARAVLTDEAHVDHVRALLDEQRAIDAAVVPVLVIADGEPPEGTLSYERLACTEPGSPARDDLGLGDVAWMLYTSGTTGRPKGVLLTQRGCLWVVAACWAPIIGLSEDDTMLCPLPLFHSYALVLCVLGVFATGATERILGGFSPSKVLGLLEDGPYTVLPGVPTMFQYLLHTGGETSVRTGALRLCVSAGAIMPGSLNESFERALGVPLLDGYGITETSTMVTMNWPVGGRVMGSCGLPVPGVGVRLVSTVTGEDVAPGEEGELWVSGPLVMAGYHNRPEATAEVLRHGWYRTGDLAQRDLNGFITISGRTKELIIRGGENIYPAEVEEVLQDAPDVADAAVIGHPHPDLGEVPVAFIVPERAGALDLEAVLAECRGRLSAFKVPERLIEVDSIPRTGSGKILRHRLRRLLDLPRPGRH